MPLRIPTDIFVMHRGTVTFQGTADDLARWGAEAHAIDRNMIMAERAGWNAAIAWVEKHLDEYVNEHGSYDYSTGTTEFPDGGEYAGSIEELIDGMRKAMPAARREATHISTLVTAAKALKADMLERAQIGMDVIHGEEYRIVNAGRTAWTDFCEALAAFERSTDGQHAKHIQPTS